MSADSESRSTTTWQSATTFGVDDRAAFQANVARGATPEELWRQLLPFVSSGKARSKLPLGPLIPLGSVSPRTIATPSLTDHRNGKGVSILKGSYRLLEPINGGVVRQPPVVLEAPGSPYRTPRTAMVSTADSVNPAERLNIGAVLEMRFSRPASFRRGASTLSAADHRSAYSRYPSDRLQRLGSSLTPFVLNGSSHQLSIPNYASPTKSLENGTNSLRNASLFELMPIADADQVEGSWGSLSGDVPAISRHSKLLLSESRNNAIHIGVDNALVADAVGPCFDRFTFRPTGPFASHDVAQERLFSLGVPVLSSLEEMPEVTSIFEMLEAHGRDTFVVVAMNVLVRYSFLDVYDVDIAKLYHFIKDANSYFHTGNPYHNVMNAVGTVLAAHAWLSQSSVGTHLSDEEIFAFVMAATVMRVFHCGVDNHFLADTDHPYAMIFSYVSPQQGATVALLLALLRKPENAFLPLTGPPSRHDRTFPINPTETQSTHRVQELVFEMLFELVMATDERNHYILRGDIGRIRDLHFQRHGCVCRSASSATMSLKKASCRRCCSYINDSQVPVVLRAVLHLIDNSYLFHAYSAFLLGALTYSAEVYRQCEHKVSAMRHHSPSNTARTDGAAALVIADLLACGRWREDATQTSTRGTLCMQACPQGCLRVGSAEAVHLHRERNEQPHLPPGQAQLPDRPLQGYARDICLLSLEEVYIPYIEELQPYIPPRWVDAVRSNQQRLLSELPTPLEYDTVVERLLHPQSAQHAVWYPIDHILIAQHLPWKLIAEHLTVRAEWSFDSEGLESRLLAEVLGPHMRWIEDALRQRTLQSPATERGAVEVPQLP